MSGRFRVFVAIKLAPTLVESLLKQRRLWQRAIPLRTVRWVQPHQFHLTLHFLGNLEADSIPALTNALRGQLTGCAGVTLSLAGFGGFPSLSQPRVLWVGLEGDLDELGGIQERVRTASAGFGDADERREFRPHLTVGRVETRSPSTIRAIGAAVEAMAPRVGGSWHAREVCLIRSVQTPNGSRYTDLAAFPLGIHLETPPPADS